MSNSWHTLKFLILPTFQKLPFRK